MQTLEIAACAVGQDHRRSRLWILGHTDRDGKSGVRFNDEVAWVQISGSVARGVGKDDGIPSRMDRLAALGNAVVPQIAEIIGRAIMDVEEFAARRSDAVFPAQDQAATEPALMRYVTTKLDPTA